MTDQLEPEAAASRPTPAAHVHHPPHAVVDSTKPAGIVSRGISAIIDVGTVWTILAFVYLGLVFARWIIDATNFSVPAPGVLFTATGFIAMSIIYNSLCWAISGRTLGCVIMGLRVRGRVRDPMRPVIAVLRAVFYTFFPVGLLWAAVDMRRRSIPDIVLGTRVLYSRKVARAAAVPSR